MTSLTRPTTARTGAGGQTAALHLPRRLSIKAGSEAILPVAVVLIVVFASLLSWLPGRATPSGPVGGPAGDGPGPRVALGGLAGGGGTDGAGPTEANPAETTTSSTPSSQRVGTTARDPEVATLAGRGGAPVTPGARPYSLDGTIMKPVAVDTSVADGRALLKYYKVSKGDTLTGIANRFGVSMMTVWWANNLKSRTDFRVGDTLTIPPVDGIVFTAREGDTLAAVGQTYDVDPETIYKMNGLEDRVLLVGQTLVLPGAVGQAIATPGRKTPPTSKSTSKPKPPSSSTGSAGPPIHEPTEYTGGPMLWPVLGGANFISQYFHAGHYAVDIAADYGSRAVAAASGTVIFAGWKSNGGGYQVWVAHGSGLYTTYNHMSAVTVGRGQTVNRGQQVGRVGQSGNASGPHLHFEVWRGPVWNGGTRVNPLIYL